MFYGLFGHFDPLIRCRERSSRKWNDVGRNPAEPAWLCARKVGGNIATMCPICPVSLRKAAKAKGTVEVNDLSDTLAKTYGV